MTPPTIPDKYPAQTEATNQNHAVIASPNGAWQSPGTVPTIVPLWQEIATSLRSSQ